MIKKLCHFGLNLGGLGLFSEGKRWVLCLRWEKESKGYLLEGLK
jgi:hypothetical protein